MEKHTTTAKSKITRRNYSRISGSLELPNLVEIQTNSYKWFKEVGIKEVFDDIYPITNFNETLSLEFVDCAFDEPKYSVNESKDRDANYAAPIRATLRLINSGTGEIKASQDDTTGTEIGWFTVMTVDSDNPILITSMVEDVKNRGGSGYVVNHTKQLLDNYLK